MPTTDGSPDRVPPGHNPPGRKLPGWQARLTDFLRAHHRRPFAPGRWDCAIWTAGAVEAMTGCGSPARVPGLQDHRGRPTQAAGEGLRRPRRLCRLAPAGGAAGLRPPGDVAVIEGQSLGIVQGAQVYVFGVNGFGMAPFTVIQRAFRT